MVAASRVLARCVLVLSLITLVKASVSTASEPSEPLLTDPSALIEEAARTISTTFWREFSAKGSAEYYLPQCVGPADPKNSSECSRNTVKMSFSLYSKLPAPADSKDDAAIDLKSWVFEGSTYQQFSSSPGMVFKTFYKNGHKLSGLVKVQDDKWSPQMCEFLSAKSFFDTASKSYVPVPTRDRYKDKTKSKQTLPEAKFQKSSEDGCPCQTLRVVIAGRVFTLVFNRKQKLRLVYSRDIKIEIDQWFPNRRDFKVLPSNLDTLMGICIKQPKAVKPPQDNARTLAPANAPTEAMGVDPPTVSDKGPVVIDPNDADKQNLAIFLGDKRAVDAKYRLGAASGNSANMAATPDSGPKQELQTASLIELEAASDQTSIPASVLLAESDEIHASIQAPSVDWHPQHDLHRTTDATVLLETAARAYTGAQATVTHTVEKDHATGVEFHSVTRTFTGVPSSSATSLLELKGVCDKDDLGDGYCDDICNTAQYEYDGGDCCRGTCGTDGSVNYACGSRGYSCKAEQVKKRPACLFLHGAGEKGPEKPEVVQFQLEQKAEGVPFIGLQNYWGDLASELEGGCSVVTYSWAKTKDYAWNDAALYRPYYSKAKEVYSKKGIVFAHSMGNVILAGACYLNASMCDVRFYMLGGPVRGSRVADVGIKLQKIPGFSWVLASKIDTGIRSLATTNEPFMSGSKPDALAKHMASKNLLLGAACGIGAWGSGGMMGLGLSAVRQAAWGTFICKKTFLGICTSWDTVEADGYVHFKECAMQNSDQFFGTFATNYMMPYYKYDGNHGDLTGMNGNHALFYEYLRVRIQDQHAQAAKTF